MAYPKLLYRLGTEEEVWGVPVDTLRVADEVAEASAHEEGWSAVEELFDEDGKLREVEAAALSLLDGKVADIVAVLPQLTAEELEALKADELAGKTRKGVLEGIEAALAALATKDAE